MPEAAVKRILVVEDEAPIRRLLVKILSKVPQYQVAEAADGVAALEVFTRQGPFDLMVCDVQMPRMNGEELVGKIMAQWPRTAILMLTAMRDDETVVRCLERGALDYLTKPLEVAKLIKAVDRAFDRREHLPAEPGGLEVKSSVHGWVELTAPSHFDYVERFQHFTQKLYETTLSREEQEDIRVAINEIGQNAVEWGNRQDIAKRICLSYCLFGDRVVFKIEDQGEGFDVAKLKDPSRDPLVHIMERLSQGKRVGGYGIFMTRSIMDEVVYSERGNIVVMTKYFRSAQRGERQPEAPPSPGGSGA